MSSCGSRGPNGAAVIRNSLENIVSFASRFYKVSRDQLIIGFSEPISEHMPCTVYIQVLMFSGPLCSVMAWERNELGEWVNMSMVQPD